MKKTLVCTLAALSLSLFSADLQQIRETKEFYSSRYLSGKNGSFTLTAPGFALSKKALKFAPGKKYEISAQVRVTPGAAKPAWVYLSLCPFTKKGQRFASEHVYIAPGTETVLAKAVKAGDDTIVLKNASKWDNKHRFSYIAFGAEKDFSDLPNFTISRSVTGSIEEDEGTWSITLQKPLKKAYPAGTAVRQHISGGTYIHAVYKKPTDKWVTFKGVVSGDILKSGRSDRQLWAGTAGVRLNISAAGKGKVDIKNIRITEVK